MLTLNKFLFCQSPFINSLQTSLMLNGGFAGSKVKPRLCLAFLGSNQVTSKRNAEYISYDQFSSKQKIGWGIYALRESNKRQVILEDKYTLNFDSPLLKPDGTLKQNKIMLGLSVSPKYNMVPLQKLKIRSSTISNSLGLEYTRSSEIVGGFGAESNSIISTNGTTLIVPDSLYFAESEVISDKISLNIATKFNSKSSLLAYQLKLSTDIIAEDYTLYAGSQLLDDYTFKTTEKLSGVVVSAIHNFSVAHVLFNNTGNNVKWNNYVGIQLHHHIPFANPANESIFISEAVRFRYSLDLLHILNLVSYLRLNMLMLGSTFHKYQNYQSVGLLGGLHLRKARIVIVFAPFKTNTVGRTVEISINYKLRQ